MPKTLARKPGFIPGRAKKTLATVLRHCNSTSPAPPTSMLQRHALWTCKYKNERFFRTLKRTLKCPPTLKEGVWGILIAPDVSLIPASVFFARPDIHMYIFIYICMSDGKSWYKHKNKKNKSVLWTNHSKVKAGGQLILKTHQIGNNMTFEKKTRSTEEQGFDCGTARH